ncbi:MAG: endo-1,4-beta-xylanase [Cytophagaceae bacterium]|nr:endo-1,4-beta-xylanase [Cytophagaceae bacterium]
MNKIIYVFLALCLRLVMAQNTPPSCVITSPFSNAYYQAGTTVQINVYASNTGGSRSGSVSKVEFFNGTVKLGEALSGTNNTYTFLWNGVPAGTYTLRAKATNNYGVSFTSAGVKFMVGTAPVAPKGMSACKGKYLANIATTNGATFPSSYNTYWNGVTAENQCKWGSIEGTRNVMNWGGADVAYNYAKNNHMMFRYHALAWGNQYPQWITSLSPTEFQREMEEYMSKIAERYPDAIDQFDVLNEQLPNHAPGTNYFKNGLGGTGATGYDWQIWLFTKARQYFPNSKLILNDYGLENNAGSVNEMLGLVKALRDRGLIDGFGTQAHWFSLEFGLQNNPNGLRSILDLMAQGGVPIYVTELDVKGGTAQTESGQYTSLSNLFPVYWNHPAVAGITYWGYVNGRTWVDGSGLVNQDGSERQAMRWLKSFMAGLPDKGYPFCSSNVPACSASITTVANSFCAGSSLVLTATSGSSYKWFNGSTQVATTASYTATSAGTYSVEVTFANGCRATSAAKTLTVTPATTWYRDADGDGKGDVSQTLSACTQPMGYVATAGDACPNDANKDTPGLCGCGIVEGTCVNTPPVLSFTRPLTNATLAAPATLVVNVAATDADGIANVQLALNNVAVRTEFVAPYDWNHLAQDPALQNLGAGTHVLKAIATDSRGASSETSITITVQAADPCLTAALPSVSISSPSNNTAFTEGQTIALAATASSGSSITKVEFFQGTTLIGMDASAPYTFATNSLRAGTYALSAKVSDQCGRSAVSSPINVTITGLVSQDPILGPSCGRALQSLTFELSAAAKTNATTVAWWFTGSSSSVMPAADKMSATIVLSQYFSMGEVCAGVNTSTAPYYKQYCKPVSTCVLRTAEASEARAASLNIYPMPSVGEQLVIDASAFQEIPASIEILNEHGQVVLTSKATEVLTNLSLSKLSQGLYTLKVLVQGSVYYEKLLIQR